MAELDHGQRRILRWEKPRPPHRVNPDPRTGQGRRAGSQWDAVALALAAHPGRWGLIFEGPKTRASALAAAVNEGRIQCWRPAGAFYAVYRSRCTGEQAVYAKYIGEEQGHDGSVRVA